MSEDARFVIRSYRPGDEEGILALFNAVFAEDDPGHRPRTMARWRWEWLDNPAGAATHVVLGIDRATGVVVCQYACIPYRVLLRGEPTVAACGVDSFLHPAYRQGLKREGVWLRVARHYFAEIGRMPGASFGYGTPNEKAWRIGVRALGYQPVHDPEWNLVRDLAGAGAAAGRRCALLRFEEVRTFDPRFDELWRRVAPSLALATIRDARYLNWRYAAAPEIPYRSFAAVDEAGSVRGFTVVRPDWQAAGLLAVPEVFVAPDDWEAFAMLLAGIDEFARRTAQGRIEIRLPPSWPHFAAGAEMGFRAEAGRFRLALVPYRQDLDAAWARQHWYYTLGDLDAF